MAGARLKTKDKQYEQLVRGTDKLHRDIENLETAYFLHRQIVEEDQSNVRGMIRKEVGGPRWAHGGAGKLTTYKSRKDLVDQKHQVLQKDSANNQANQSPLELNSRTTVLDGNEQSSNNDLSPVQVDKILDLKTKVLKKASSNIIRRDTWSAPSRLVKPANNKVPKIEKDKDKNNTGGKKENADISITKPSKPGRRHNQLRRESSESSRSPGYTVQNPKENKQKNVQAQTFKKERNQTDTENNGIKSQRRSRIDVFKDYGESVRLLRHSVSDDPEQNGFDSDVNRGDKSERTIGVTYTPRKLQAHSGKVVENGVSPGIFPTQPQEPTEIYIDPRKGQVRVLAGKEENFNDISSLEGTKVLVQSSSLQNSLDGNKLACSVVEECANSSPQKEIRDIFGLEDFNTRPVSAGRKHVTSTSPFATSRQCNTEVEFWLRGLGIPDVERYVRIFAENEIDLTDLEFMSASQLHDMGVTAFGALDKILKGIRDLKNQPITQMENSGGVKLQSSSVAWEEMSPVQKRKTVNDKSNGKASKVRKSNSCHHETLVKQSLEYSLLGYRDTDIERCSSAMSQSEGNIETPKNSARSETPSFAASTKSSSAKCTEKRPPCAKTSTGVKNKSNVSQTQNKNVNSSSKLRRSNSAASEKPEPKLSNLENKPTKGVLLRPRSASLTREPPRGTRETQGKKEERKELRQLRSRSRSADVVKRKALEGVHAAAKKFEEKKLKSKETDKSFPPCDERKKLRRDEMAARHLQREKYKEMMIADSSGSDMDENVKQQISRDTDSDRGLENLVTVNILSPPRKSDPQASPSKQEEKGKTQVVRPEMRKSLRRLEQTRRQKYSAVRPIELQMESDTEPPLLATYKISNKDRDKNHSEPESGYRTDGSTTYSQIEDRVSDIQRKIKRLKARATSGDEMTLTLVQDLQEQLSHFEKQLKDKEKEMRNHQSDLESSRENQSARRLPINLNSSTNTSPISELLVQSPARTEEEEHEPVGSGVRMSKRELLDEMRKEKQQHHRQIRQLQSELQKFRHSDPVTSLELDRKDITYKQDDLIGEGTFSCVYKGEFQGSEVAVKQLKMPLQQQDRNYFAAEVSLLKELRHPRVVLLIGVCTSSKLPLMVLEYMSQGSLFNYLHNPECESLDHALYYQVARDIALGMNYLHSHKPEVLHLDLKSMNVLLCESLRAKIADFGFSKLRLDAGLKSGKRGKFKTKVATPAWMSPELLDKGEITGKSDVFSFGIILWEMLTRSSPYKECTVFQILEMVRKNQRPEIPEGTPEGLSHLVKVCWDPNPAKRPQFKDILQILENLAFPPAWRELFQKAGVPESALHDVQSTRTIISLVTGTLDSGKSGILHSFMVSHSEKGKNGQRRENVETDTTFKSKRTSSGRKSKSKQSVDESVKDSARSSASSRVSSTLEDWDSDTVTSVSEKLSSEDSDLTLRNIRDSSSDDNDSRSDSDESSLLTSDDGFNYSTHVNKQNVPKTEINVVIPNLELSLQSVREEFKAERNRISRETSDWVSLSLDDRTDRSDLNERQRTDPPVDNKADHGDMRLRLSSNLSSRSPTPPSPTKSTPSMLNESARSKRRNKGKDLNRYSDEFLMRESFHNRRPPSPKKKSLTKKFMETSDRKLGNENTEGIEDLTDRSVKSNPDRKSSTAKKESFVERSYDSFFDLSDKQVYSGASKRQSLISGSESRVSFVNSSENSKVVESWNRMDEDKKIIDPACEISVEDMENEVKAEGSPRKRNETPRCSISKSGSSNSAQDFKVNVNRSQSLVIEEIRNRSGPLQQISGNEVEKCNYVEPFKPNNSNEFENEEVRSKRQSHTLVKGLSRQQMADIGEMNKNNNSKISRTKGIWTESEIQSEQADKWVDSQGHERVESQQFDVYENRNKLKQTRRHSEERRKHSSGKAFNETSVGMSSGKMELPVDNIRVVLNPELTRAECIGASSEGPVKSLETHTPTFDKGMCKIKKLPEEFKQEAEENTEQIRVTLDLSEVTEKKKKPAITPRKSLMLSNRSLKSSERTMNEVNQNTDTKKSGKGENNNNEIDSSSTHLAGNTSKNSKLLEQGEGKPDSLNHDSGSDPNTKSSSWSSYVSSSESKSRSVENRKNKEGVVSPKKNTIRVKLRKDPLAQPTDSSNYKNSASFPMPPSSPVPPAPPPPPPELSKSVSVVSRSMQDSAPRGSMADELKSRLANRQSVSEGMLFKGKMSERNTMFKKQPQGKNVCVTRQNEGQPRLVKISEMDEKLFPQQSEGLPSFVVQSLDLQDQKDQLKSITKPHPHQLDDLSNASQEQLTSIADILKKAVMGRRLAMGEDGDSVSQSLESAATGWSVDL